MACRSPTLAVKGTTMIKGWLLNVQRIGKPPSDLPLRTSSNSMPGGNLKGTKGFMLARLGAADKLSLPGASRSPGSQKGSHGCNHGCARGCDGRALNFGCCCDGGDCGDDGHCCGGGCGCSRCSGKGGGGGGPRESWTRGPDGGGGGCLFATGGDDGIEGCTDGASVLTGGVGHVPANNAFGTSQSNCVGDEESNPKNVCCDQNCSCSSSARATTCCKTPCIRCNVAAVHLLVKFRLRWCGSTTTTAWWVHCDPRGLIPPSRTSTTTVPKSHVATNRNKQIHTSLGWRRSPSFCKHARPTKLQNAALKVLWRCINFCALSTHKNKRKPALSSGRNWLTLEHRKLAYRCVVHHGVISPETPPM